MWKRGMAKAYSIYGDGSTRRRGARLGLLIALLAVIPGLVAGTSFISGAATSSLNGTSTPVSALQCGFDLGNTHSLDVGPLTVTGTTQIGATVLYSAIAVTLNAYEVGGSGYEYLDGEIDIGCVNVNQPGFLSLYGTTTTIPTGLSWMDAVVEAGTAAPFNSATVPSIDYCGPAAIPPTAFPTAFGTACPGTGTAQTSCDSTPTPHVYLPNDADTTYYVYNVVAGGTALGTCGTTLGTAGPGTTIVSTLTQNAAVYYYGIVSFGLGGALSTVSTAAFSLTLSGTAT